MKISATISRAANPPFMWSAPAMTFLDEIGDLGAKSAVEINNEYGHTPTMLLLDFLILLAEDEGV